MRKVISVVVAIIYLTIAVAYIMSLQIHEDEKITDNDAAIGLLMLVGGFLLGNALIALLG